MLYEQTGRRNVSLVSSLGFRMGGFILYQPLCFIESVLRRGEAVGHCRKREVFFSDF